MVYLQLHIYPLTLLGFSCLYLGEVQSAENWTKQFTYRQCESHHLHQGQWLIEIIIVEYSQNCIKRSLLRQRKNGHLRRVTSLKRFNSYEILYDWKGKGDLLRQVISLKRFNSYERFYDGKGKGDLLRQVTSLKRFNLYKIFYDGRGKGDILRQVTSLKRFNSYDIFYDGRRKGWPFKTGDLLKEVKLIWNFLWCDRKMVTF